MSTLEPQKNLADWLRQQYDSSRPLFTEQRLDSIGTFFGNDIGSLLNPDTQFFGDNLTLFEVVNEILDSGTLPILRYREVELGLELYFYFYGRERWLVTCKLTGSRRVGYSRLHGLIERGSITKSEPPLNKLPGQLQDFKPFGVQTDAFYVWLKSSHWVHTFLDMLLEELRQAQT